MVNRNKMRQVQKFKILQVCVVSENFTSKINAYMDREENTVNGEIISISISGFNYLLQATKH